MQRARSTIDPNTNLVSLVHLYTPEKLAQAAIESKVQSLGKLELLIDVNG